VRTPEQSAGRAATVGEPKICHVTFQPLGISYAVSFGDTLFETAVQAGVEVDTVCGGNGSCGKCKVKFLSEPPPAVPLDHAHLAGAEIQDGYRLSCQVITQEDMVVDVPPAGGRLGVQILHEGIQRDVELRPNIRRIFIPYTHPRRRDGIADWDAVKNSLPRWFRSVTVPLHWLRRLPAFIRDEAGMTLTVAGREVTRIERGDTTEGNYGVAFDVGSTTVVGYLIDLSSGAEITAASDLNYQARYGDDLIARLSRAQYNPDGLRQMHELIIAQLNDLLTQLADDASIPITQINEVTIVGNMAMHHFLLGLDSTFLGLSPYAPVIRDAVTVSAAELGLVLDPDCQVYILPNIAGFVGSDTVGVILAGGLHRRDGIRLAVDVGTNGEIAMSAGGSLIACSSPAGPAFEGARIKMGMRAAQGAIDHVRLDGGDLDFSVIGNGPPIGICGSALIDLTASLLQAGMLTWRGHLVAGDNLPDSVPANLRDRLVEAELSRDNYFVVARAGEQGAERDVIFTQQDIREFQMAKGAIRAGEMVLQQQMGADDGDLEMVLLAGAFGTFINLENAREVNLVPDIPLERLRSVGNAAGVGARLALISTKERIAAERIGRQTEHIQLSGLDNFQKAFIHAMRFPRAKS
jgi:uncharacterized 2Fe-2S/4Fe-4S cluster protein (DUF4445 family)|tara:strand:- start:1145 stop:3049 length:1905 start_codon:yes stop_codon:yes gene_type:complete